MNHKQIKFGTKAITNQYLVGRTLDEFAADLGINASRQMVWMWKEGIQSPAYLTLAKVILSNSSASWAVQWAKECSAVYLRED